MGRKYAIIAIDYFSRFAVVSMLSRPTAPVIISAVREIFRQLGVFQSILTDPGPQFIAKKFKNFLRNHKIHHYIGSPRNYRATGVVERLARTLKSIAAKMVPQDLSAQALLAAVHDYNRTPHSATGTAPLAAFWGIQPVLRIDAKLGSQPPPPLPQHQVLENQHTFASSWAHRLNRNRPQFQKGDQVFFYPRIATTQAHDASRHLRPRAFGPFTVTGHCPHNRVQVSALQDNFVFPASRLRLSHLP
jgi:hypothetical protein